MDKAIEEELHEAKRLLEYPLKMDRAAQSPTLSILDKGRQQKITIAC
jgi:hypothetical protein